MEKREKIINYFNTHHDNRSPVIAKKLKVKTSYVNSVLDVYLSTKNNYMGEVKTEEKEEKKLKYKSECIETREIEYFTTLTAIANKRGVTPQCLAHQLKGLKFAKIKHRLKKNTYLYTKL